MIGLLRGLRPRHRVFTSVLPSHSAMSTSITKRVVTEDPQKQQQEESTKRKIEGEEESPEKMAKKPRKAVSSPKKAAASPLKKSAATKSTPAKETKKRKKETSDPEAVFPRDEVARKELVDGHKYLKVLSWNVNGMRALLKNKKHVLEELVKTESPDVLCLQETKLQESHVKDDFKNLLKGYTSYYSCSTAKKGYAGTALFVKDGAVPKADQKVDFGIDKDEHDKEGRSITLLLPFVNLIGLYVPNSGQKLERLDYRTTEWDLDLRKFMKKLTTETGNPTIIFGDLNVAHRDIDLYNPDAKHIPKTPGCTAKERESFTKFLEEDGYVDSFRFLHPDAIGQFSYWSIRAKNHKFNRGLRLDYFCVPRGMTETENKFNVSLHDSFVMAPNPEDMASDHSPVGLVLQLNE